MLNYLTAAKALDELMLELIDKDLPAPAHVVDDLKASRALASMEARQPGANPALEAKIMPVLERVEMNLLSLAEMAGGTEYADGWQGKIAGAYQSPAQAPAIPGKMRGVPRDAWPIRIQTSELEGCQPADELELTAIEQEDGYTLIYGKKENISVFLKGLRQIQEKHGKVGFQRNS